MIEKVIFEQETIAIMIRSSHKGDGIEFFTPVNFSQQLAYMNRAEGYTIEPHRHKQVARMINFTQEVLLIKSGKVRVDFFDNYENFIKSSVLFEGDVILLASGGHGLEFLEDSEIIEIKQGPYNKETDKTRFEAVALLSH